MAFESLCPPRVWPGLNLHRLQKRRKPNENIVRMLDVTGKIIYAKTDPV